MQAAARCRTRPDRRYRKAMANLTRAVLAACVSIGTALSGAADAGSNGSLRRASAGTVVPAVQRLPVEQAYDRLHRAGFRVSFVRKLTLPAESVAEVVSQKPQAGEHVRRGGIVNIRLSVSPMGAGSPAVPDELKSFTVPNFRSQPVTTAAKWAEGAQLQWEATLPRLSAGSAAHLLGNYAVVHQEPAPGARLSLGREAPNDGFTPTPLKLRVGQR